MVRLVCLEAARARVPASKLSNGYTEVSGDSVLHAGASNDLGLHPERPERHSPTCSKTGFGDTPVSRSVAASLFQRRRVSRTCVEARGSQPNVARWRAILVVASARRIARSPAP